MKHPLVLFMERKLITQAEIAAKIGVSEGTISRWLRGLSAPSAYYALEIERATAGDVKFTDMVAWLISPTRTVIPNRQYRTYARRYGWVKAVWGKKKKPKKRSK